MRKSIFLLAALCAAPLAAQTRDWNDPIHMAFVNANLKGKDRSPILYWRPASELPNGALKSFAARHTLLATPVVPLFTHDNDGSSLYVGFNRAGDLVGGVTPFGTNPCLSGPPTRTPQLFMIVNGVRKAVPVKPMQRMDVAGSAGKTQTVCFLPFTLSASELKARYGAAPDKAVVHWAVVVDKTVNHSFWVAERGPDGILRGKTSAHYTVVQLREFAVAAAKMPQ